MSVQHERVFFPPQLQIDQAMSSAPSSSATPASSSANDIRVIDRAELEKFAATRRLPEAVLAQLRARAKAEIAAGAGAHAAPGAALARCSLVGA